MFEAAELGRTVAKEEYLAQIPELRTRLLAAQRRLAGCNVPVIILIAGVEGAGKGEVVNTLNEWLDTRGIQTHAFWDETDEETERPAWWRYWRAMPPKGNIAILFGGWYSPPLIEHYEGTWHDGRLDAELSRIRDFEQMLAVDGTLIVKFWFHLPHDEQKDRIRKLSKDPHSRWYQSPPDKKEFADHYRRFLRTAETVVRETDSGLNPWYLIEATDRRYRDLTVGRTLLQAIESRLEHHGLTAPEPTSHAPSLPAVPTAQITVLDHVDLSLTIDRDEYKKAIKEYQAELNDLVWDLWAKKRSCVMVFEGWDAAGKGGAIRRITQAIDSRLYRVIPIAAPTDEERAHHYLWRFWRHIPRGGRLTVFDRSWYGRVLVERVEGFAKDHEWQRAYHEINEFEQQLDEHGIVLLKFWLHIGKDEQLRRFRERETVAYKQHKITDEDWRNREKWDGYKAAVNEMVFRTSTDYAPWTLIPGNDKAAGRVAVLKTARERLQKALD